MVYTYNEYHKKGNNSLAHEYLCYKIFIALSAVFGSVCVIDAACYFLAAPIYVWAGIVLYIKLIKEMKLRKIKHLPIITLFIASGLISVAVNFAYNIHENLFMIYYVILCFFLFYGLYAEKTHEAAKREMTFFFKFFLSSTTILMAISIVILLFSKKALCLWIIT